MYAERISQRSPCVSSLKNVEGFAHTTLSRRRNPSLDRAAASQAREDRSPSQDAHASGDATSGCHDQEHAPRWGGSWRDPFRRRIRRGRASEQTLALPGSSDWRRSPCGGALLGGPVLSRYARPQRGRPTTGPPPTPRCCTSVPTRSPSSHDQQGSNRYPCISTPIGSARQRWRGWNLVSSALNGIAYDSVRVNLGGLFVCEASAPSEDGWSRPETAI